MNHHVGGEDNTGAKIGMTIFFIVIGFLYFLSCNGYFYKLIYMKENVALTKQFNILYKDSDFESFKMTCYSNKSEAEFKVFGEKFKYTDGPNFCLYSPGYDENWPAYLEISKTSGTTPSYKVMTTGEEMDKYYDPKTVESLKKVIGQYHYRVAGEKDRRQSWIDAS